MQILEAFGIEISRFTVGRILRKNKDKLPSGDGPSWLTFIGHMKDSLWSRDARVVKKLVHIRKSIAWQSSRPFQCRLQGFWFNLRLAMRRHCQLFFGESSLRHTLREYMAHYNAERNHQSKGNVLLIPSPTTNADQCRDSTIHSRERLGGLLQYYYLEAA